MATYGDFTAVKRAMVGGWKEYSFTTADGHICAIDNLKWLKFEASTDTLYLSLDGGSTYPNSIDLTGVCDIITRAKFYANGNIMWANQTQCFYSTDNLETYNESTVLDINGNTFVPDTYDNFKPLTYDNRIIINGVEIDVWGNYSIDSTLINAWYTIDSGITIKSAFLDGTTIAGQDFRHIHGITYNDTDDSFHMFYGDEDSGINKGSYDWDLDAWTWENLVNEDGSGHHKITGLRFLNDYAYWTSDSSNAANHGVWKCPYADWTTGTNYEQVRDLPSPSINLFGSDGLLLVSGYSSARVDASWDYGATWVTYTLTGGPSTTAGFMYYAIHGDDDVAGYYVANIQEDPATEPEYLSASGITLLLRVYKNKILN